MPLKSDTKSPKFIYDLPTLDDPSRPNVNGINDPAHPSYNGIDVGDPFGGNDGLNQAMIVPGGPVQIYSPGFRNCYDLVITKAGRLYVTDNGANLGWGGLPKNESPPVNGVSHVTNEYNYVLNSLGQALELGGDSGYPYNGQMVNNKDQLHLITGIGDQSVNTYVPGNYYGGHPTPVRANPSGAGLLHIMGAMLSCIPGISVRKITTPMGPEKQQTLRKRCLPTGRRCHLIWLTRWKEIT